MNIKKYSLVMKLVYDDIVKVKQNLEYYDVWWLGQILETGFIGYQNQSIKELKQELKEREIK